MSEIREPVTHNLKILPENYSAVCAGVKRAELRKNDRDYRAGDTLDLCEWDKDDESFTGNYISVTVTHVADVSEWMPGYVLLSIELALRERAEPVYQVQAMDWHDVEKYLYDEALDRGIRCRVIYTAPPAPVAASWIAFSERMPELDTRVLLYFPDYGGHIEDGCIGDEGDGHYHYFFDGYSLRHEPTHWMPLPEAPGKEG
ncbi:DUF3850 domain-containing protein [Cronobacter sakazakii]|nr:DUF3850 domain-containing protein [Cronobacter sakazakii]